MRFVVPIAMAYPEEEEVAPLLEYIRRVSRKLGLDFIENDDMESFRFLLEMDLVTQGSIELFLKEANRLGRTEATAYLLEYGDNRKKRGFSAFSL